MKTRQKFVSTDLILTSSSFELRNESDCQDFACFVSWRCKREKMRFQHIQPYLSHSISLLTKDFINNMFPEGIYLWMVLRQVLCALWLHCIVLASFSIWWWKLQNQILTENSGKVKPFLFPFTIGKWNLIYSECVGECFVLICWVFYDSQGQT